MNVKMIRSSGNPVDPVKLEEFENAWKNGFDSIVEKHGKFGPETSDALEKLEYDLKQKYNDLTVAEVSMPKSKKAWKEMATKYGNIIVTTAAETNNHIKEGDLLLVVHDLIM